MRLSQVPNTPLAQNVNLCGLRPFCICLPALHIACGVLCAGRNHAICKDSAGPCCRGRLRGGRAGERTTGASAAGQAAAGHHPRPLDLLTHPFPMSAGMSDRARPSRLQWSGSPGSSRWTAAHSLSSPIFLQLSPSSPRFNHELRRKLRAVRLICGPTQPRNQVGCMAVWSLSAPRNPRIWEAA